MFVLIVITARPVSFFARFFYLQHRSYFNREIKNRNRLKAFIFPRSYDFAWFIWLSFVFHSIPQEQLITDPDISYTMYNHHVYSATHPSIYYLWCSVQLVLWFYLSVDHSILVLILYLFLAFQRFVRERILWRLIQTESASYAVNLVCIVLWTDDISTFL